MLAKNYARSRTIGWNECNRFDRLYNFITHLEHNKNTKKQFIFRYALRPDVVGGFESGMFMESWTGPTVQSQVPTITTNNLHENIYVY